MLRWSQSQRELLAETIRDVANIAAGAMVFGQFLSDAEFSPILTVTGILFWGCLVVLAVRLVEEKMS